MPTEQLPSAGLYFFELFLEFPISFQQQNLETALEIQFKLKNQYLPKR